MARRRKGAGLHLRRATPVLDELGRRHCAACGDFIDPIDWCALCQAGTCQTHRRLRKRTDAAFCNDGCRTWQRTSYIRDCL